MFNSITLHPKTSGRKAAIHISDSCFGIYSFEPPPRVSGDLYGYLLYHVFRVYHERKLNPLNAVRRCLRWMYYRNGIDMHFVINCAVLESTKYPTGNFIRYEPILTKIYVPRILSES